MKKDPPIKILYDLISEKLSPSVLIGIYAFIGSTLLVVIISLLSNVYTGQQFWENLLVEAHGMLFDVLVIGVIILFLNKLAEKRVDNRRYLEEIDDFRGWKDKEAAYRIAGNLKRLKRNGYKGKIDLRNCYLGSADLQTERLREYLEYFPKYLSGINLTGSDLSCAHLRGADLHDAVLEKANLPGADLTDANLQDTNLLEAKLQGAYLQGTRLQGAILLSAKLQGADLLGANLWNANLQAADLHDDAVLLNANFQAANLRGVTNLTLDQLSEVKSLCGAELDPKLKKQVKVKYPYLLEEPAD